VTLPDFLLVGAPKAGTTALHVALAEHPQLAMSAIKEPKHFLVDGPPPTGGGPGDAKTYSEYVWQRADYEALWTHAEPAQLKGESTTLYLQSPAAHRRIRAAVPDVKLIAVLRDPIDRAHSNWSHLRSAGLEPVSDFARACMLGAERLAAGWGPFWGYLEVGLYGSQLDHLYSVFPREQVLLLRYRDLRESAAATLDIVCAFLGVQTGLLTRIPSENVTAHVSESPLNRRLHQLVRRLDAVDHTRPGRAVRTRTTGVATQLLQRRQQTRPALDIEDRALLLPHFSSDIDLLENVTGTSFAQWRDLRNGTDRPALALSGRFGTAFQSIDRPI
jgi:hypothetical protein